MDSKTLMGTDYKMRVDFTLDDWTWLCHLLNDSVKKGAHCEECQEDLEDVLSIVQAGVAVHD